MLEANPHSQGATWLLESAHEAIETHQIDYFSPRVLLFGCVVATFHNTFEEGVTSTEGSCLDRLPVDQI